MRRFQYEFNFFLHRVFVVFFSFWLDKWLLWCICVCGSAHSHHWRWSSLAKCCSSNIFFLFTSAFWCIVWQQQQQLTTRCHHKSNRKSDDRITESFLRWLCCYCFCGCMDMCAMSGTKKHFLTKFRYVCIYSVRHQHESERAKEWRRKKNSQPKKKSNRTRKRSKKMPHQKCKHVMNVSFSRVFALAQNLCMHVNPGDKVKKVLIRLYIYCKWDIFLFTFLIFFLHSFVVAVASASSAQCRYV